MLDHIIADHIILYSLLLICPRDFLYSLFILKFVLVCECFNFKSFEYLSCDGFEYSRSFIASLSMSILEHYCLSMREYHRYFISLVCMIFLGFHCFGMQEYSMTLVSLNLQYIIVWILLTLMDLKNYLFSLFHSSFSGWRGNQLNCSYATWGTLRSSMQFITLKEKNYFIYFTIYLWRNNNNDI